MKISVILPMYNAENYIRKTIENLKKQTYDNLEIIIVDDGSIDESVEMCKKAIDGDNRFLLIKKQNGGVSSARNATS